MKAELLLSGSALEIAVQRLFSSWPATYTRGHRRSWDGLLEVPRFAVTDSVGRLINIDPQKQFVFEVKSHGYKGCQIEDLRQLNDWVVTAELRRLVAREVERVQSFKELVPHPLQSLCPSEYAPDRILGDRLVSEALRLRDVPFAELRAWSQMCEMGPGSFSVDEEQARRIREIASELLSRRRMTKGVLVINHFYMKSQRPSPLQRRQAEAYARLHELAVIGWPDLLELNEEIASGRLHHLSAMCALFDTSGLFRLGSIEPWTDKLQMYPSIIAMLDGKEEYEIVSGHRFLA